jgi:hypothetical protein
MHAKLGDGKGVSVERRGQIVHETQAAIYEEVEVHKRVVCLISLILIS